MSRTENKYTRNYIQKIFVDSLEEDGALCDYYSKYYLENDTANGGVGNRLAFKNYNDRISQFHHILQILSGERRANIYESIPVIDFMEPSNTSFLNTYPRTSEGVNPKEIIAIDASLGENPLELIDLEDPYTLNRALAGLPTAEHFYNTTDLLSSEYSLQVSPYKGVCDYIYQGIITPRAMEKGVVSSKVRKTKMLCFKSVVSTKVYFNEGLPNITPESKPFGSKIAFYDKIENPLSGKQECSDFLVLNSDCGWSPTGIDDKSKLYTPIKHEGVEVVLATEEKSRDYLGHYYINIDPNDILIALPKDSYSLGTNKILVLKYNEPSETIENTIKAEIVYYKQETGKFYTDATCSNLLTPSAGKYYIDGNFQEKEEYYIYNTEEAQFIKSPKNDYDELIVFFNDSKTVAYKDLKRTEEVTPNNHTLYKDGLSCTRVAYSYNPETMVLGIDRDVTVKDTDKTDAFYVTYKKTPDEYTCYVLYIDSFDSSFSLSSGFMEINIGDTINSLVENKSVLDILSKYIIIDRNYVANASGLLDGFFCEPIEYKDTFTSREVTKWKFTNEVLKAQSKGMSIDIGSKYYESHLLGRGTIKESPLRLTSNDLKILGTQSSLYKGKFEFIYKQLLDFNIYDFIVNKASVSLWNSSSDISIPAYKVTSVITKADYVDSSKIKASVLKDLGGDTYNVGMLYPKKFYIDSESLIDINDIDRYIDCFDKAFNEDTHTLYLDLKDDHVVSSYRFMKNKEGNCDSEGEAQHREGDDFGDDSQNRISLTSDYRTCFNVRYDVHVKKDGKTYQDSFENFTISMITPRELFRKKDYYSNSETSNPDDLIVVFPEYNKYFPEYVYVFSRYDLGLEPFDTVANKKNTCNFINTEGNKILMFKVDKVVKILPSKVWKVQIYDPKTNTKSVKSLQGETYPRISGYNKSYTYVPTEDTSFDEYKTYYKKHEATEYEPYTSYTIISKKKGNPKKKGYYEVKTSDERDCYVYKLSYFNVPVSQKINVYDWEDKPLEIKDMNLPGKIVGLSCELNGGGYFKYTEKIEEGTKVYEIFENERKRSFDILKSSFLFGGIPNKGENEKYSQFSINLGDKTVSLGILDELFSRNEEIATTALRNIVFNWPFSDSKVNPILMCDLPEVLKGIIDCKQDLIDLSKVGFTINVKGTPVTLTEDSFRNLISIIDKDRNVNYYDIKIGYSLNTIKSLMDSIKLSLGEDNKYHISSTGKSPNELILNGESIPKIYDAIIRKVISESLFVEGLEDKEGNPAPKESVLRRSLLTIYNQIKGIFDGTRTLDRNACRELDSLFGNNTLAFLNIGNQYVVDGRALTYTPQMDITQRKLIDSVIDLVTDSINVMYNKRSESLREEALTETKNIFKQYYTEESVDSCITLGTSSIDVNYLGLKINTKTSASRETFNTIKGKYDPYNSKNVIIRFFTRIFNKKTIWSTYDLDSFILKFYEKASLLDVNRINIISYFRREIQDTLDSTLSTYNSKVSTCQVTKEEVSALMMSGNVGESSNSIYLAECEGDCSEDSIKVASTTNNRIVVKITPPVIEDTLSDGVVTKIKLSKGSETFASKHFSNVFDDNIDITENTMWGLVEYIKTNLEGTNPNEQNNPYYVKYVGGEDTSPVGRPNSLYYKRYQMLNNRMNRLTGPLWKAVSTLRNSKILNSFDVIKDQTMESYSPFLEIMPISSMESLLYMPTKEAALSSDVLKGKYYSKEEIDAMRNLISNKCVLTCSKCTIQDSCPFYDKEEIIKQYCSGVESIDIWVKDNKLDLIYHDEDDASPTLISEENNEGINLNKLKTVHSPYAEIEKRFGVYTPINDLEKVRENLKQNSSLKYNDFVRDDMGWLLGARYGTVQKNTMKELLVNNEEYSDIIESIHPYSYLYDALFIEDEESYVNYTPSKHRYNVEFEMGKPGEKRHYKGNTKLQIPSSLKILYDNDEEDDVYLVSDDKVDSNGEPILPLIYLGKIKNISYVFDLTDDGIEGGVTDPLDRKLYANDVAQWCMNYYKGNLYEYPIGESSNGVADLYRDKDQYWMEKVYKQIGDRWYTFSGRKREYSGYCNPLIDVNEFDEVLSVSGRPMIANYINFLRKVSIRIYDRETQEWLIPWVNENLPVKDMNKYFKGFNGDLEKMKEKQRYVLPLMKTNLRLAVVKN